MSVKNKPNSRWVKGNERYPKAVETFIYEQYREADGWRQGARILKRKK